MEDPQCETARYTGAADFGERGRSRWRKNPAWNTGLNMSSVPGVDRWRNCGPIHKKWAFKREYGLSGAAGVGAKKGLDANENCGIIVFKFSGAGARYEIVSRNGILWF